MSTVTTSGGVFVPSEWAHDQQTNARAAYRRGQRIVGKHRNDLRMPLEKVRYWIDRALSDTGGTAESKDFARMREQLEPTLFRQRSSL